MNAVKPEPNQPNSETPVVSNIHCWKRTVWFTRKETKSSCRCKILGLRFPLFRVESLEVKFGNREEFSRREEILFR